MSDQKKPVNVDLDFGDLSGGTETKNNEKAAVVATPPIEGEPQLQETKPDVATSPAPSKTSSVFTKNIIEIPITQTDGSWKMKLIEDVTGEEFLAWVREVLPYPDNMMPKPSDYDGEKNLGKRKKAFANVVDKHIATFRYVMSAQKVDIDKVKH